MVKASVAIVILLAIRIFGATWIRGHIPEPYNDGLLSTLGVLATVAIAYLLDLMVRAIYWEAYHRRHQKRAIPTLIEDIFTVALLVVGLCVGLYFEAGLSPTGIFTASGATAIVIGIALQAVIQDMFSGLSINFDGSYAIGDWITIYMADMDEPFYGRVTGIGWRSTYLRLAEGRLLIVPNRIVTSNWMLNHSQPRGPKRQSVEIDVDVRVPTERIISILLSEAFKAVNDPRLCAVPEPSVIVKKVVQDSMILEVRFFADPNEIEPDEASAIMLRHIHGAVNRFDIPNPVSQIELAQPYEAEVKRGEKEIREILHRIALFRDVLDDAQLTVLARQCKPTMFREQKTFIRQGEEASSMFVILEGVARVVIAGADGESHQVAVLTEGDIVGEMSLLTGAPRTASVVAKSAVCALEITKDEIGALLHDSPQLLASFSHILALRQRKLDEIANRQASQGQTESDLIARMTRFFAQFF